MINAFSNSKLNTNIEISNSNFRLSESLANVCQVNDYCYTMYLLTNSVHNLLQR